MKIIIIKAPQFLIIILFALLFSYCNAKRENNAEQKVEEKENFNGFYKKYMTDSAFQISRIKFPLKGHFFRSEMIDFGKLNGVKSIGGDSLNYTWTSRNWKIEKDKPNYNDIDTNEVYLKKNISDSLIILDFFGKIHDYRYKRVFQLIKGKWFLVYYYDSFA